MPLCPPSHLSGARELNWGSKGRHNARRWIWKNAQRLTRVSSTACSSALSSVNLAFPQGKHEQKTPSTRHKRLENKGSLTVGCRRQTSSVWAARVPCAGPGSNATSGHSQLRGGDVPDRCEWTGALGERALVQCWLQDLGCPALFKVTRIDGMAQLREYLARQLKMEEERQVCQH